MPNGLPEHDLNAVVVVSASLVALPGPGDQGSGAQRLMQGWRSGVVIAAVWWSGSRPKPEWTLILCFATMAPSWTDPQVLACSYLLHLPNMLL